MIFNWGEIQSKFVVTSCGKVICGSLAECNGFRICSVGLECDSILRQESKCVALRKKFTEYVVTIYTEFLADVGRFMLYKTKYRN